MCVYIKIYNFIVRRRLNYYILVYITHEQFARMIRFSKFITINLISKILTIIWQKCVLEKF